MIKRTEERTLLNATMMRGEKENESEKREMRLGATQTHQTNTGMGCPSVLTRS